MISNLKFDLEFRLNFYHHLTAYLEFVLIIHLKKSVYHFEDVRLINRREVHLVPKPHFGNLVVLIIHVVVDHDLDALVHPVGLAQVLEDIDGADVLHLILVDVVQVRRDVAYAVAVYGESDEDLGDFHYDHLWVGGAEHCQA